MTIQLKHIKDTNNFAYFETYNTDFRFPFQIVVKMWVPRSEFEGGVIPPTMDLKICDENEAMLNEQQPQAVETWGDEIGDDPDA